MIFYNMIFYGMIDFFRPLYNIELFNSFDQLFERLNTQKQLFDRSIIMKFLKSIRSQFLIITIYHFEFHLFPWPMGWNT